MSKGVSGSPAVREARQQAEGRIPVSIGKVCRELSWQLKDFWFQTLDACRCNPPGAQRGSSPHLSKNMYVCLSGGVGLKEEVKFQMNPVMWFDQ